jgi:hypothetical protein
MKKLFFTLLFTFIGLAPQHIYTMQAAAGRTTGQIAKHILLNKKGFSGFMTTLHWTIAAGPFVMAGINRTKALLNEEKYLQNHRTANEEVTHFIKEEMQHLSPDNPLVGVKIDPYCTIGVIRKNVILNTSTHVEIAKELQENDSQTINKYKSVLQHENVHRQKEDVAIQAAISFIIPFATHGSLKIIRGLLPFAKKTTPFWKEQLKKIPTAIGKVYINLLTFTSISRYQENRADNGIKNNAKSLNGIKDFLSDTEKIEKKLDKINGLDRFPTRKKILTYFSLHPPTSQRIAKIDQRIAALEKQEQSS